RAIRANCADARPSAPSTKAHPETSGIQCADDAYPWSRPVRTLRCDRIGYHEARRNPLLVLKIRLEYGFTSLRNHNSLNRPHALTREGSKLRRFGLVTTNSIRQTFNRRVVERYLAGKAPISIIYAIPDHPWSKAGKDPAAVRIAITIVERGQADGVIS